MQAVEAQRLLNNKVSEQLWENHLYYLPDPEFGTDDLFDWYLSSPFIREAYNLTRHVIFSFTGTFDNFTEKDILGYFKGLAFDYISFGLITAQNQGKILLSPHHTSCVLRETLDSKIKFNGLLCEGDKVVKVYKYSSRDRDKARIVNRDYDSFKQIQGKAPYLFTDTKLNFVLLPWEKTDSADLPNNVGVEFVSMTSMALKEFASIQFDQFRPAPKFTDNSYEEIENPTLRELLTEVKFQKNRQK